MALYNKYVSTSEEVENAALFLRLGLSSTLIRHENKPFRKRSLKRREVFENASFAFSSDRKIF